MDSSGRWLQQRPQHGMEPREQQLAQAGGYDFSAFVPVRKLRCFGQLQRAEGDVRGSGANAAV